MIHTGTMTMTAPELLGDEVGVTRTATVHAPSRSSQVRWRLTPSIVWLILLMNVATVTALWLQHGGWPTDSAGATVFTAIGQITALWGTFAALVQILLVARVPGLDGRFGMDRLVKWHRWVGFSLVWCLIAHIVASTVGWGIGDGRPVIGEFIQLNSDQTSVLLASAATVLLFVVAVSSVRIARRSLSRELWYFVHLLSYAMMALSFPHIVEVGSDFDHHRWTTYYWVTLYAVVLAALIWHRFGNPIRNLRCHGFVLGATVKETESVTSLVLNGGRLDRFRVSAGQFVTVRFLAPGWFHRAHPFSISGFDGRSVRLTVKSLGDDSCRMPELPVGTRVVVEGPFGAFTEHARIRAKVLLIAAGIGITPIRMLFEHLSAEPGDITLLYRASSERELVFRDELDAIAADYGDSVYYLIGKRADHADMFTATSLRALLPDVADHEVYLCGPVDMIRDASAGLHAAGVSKRQIHFEDFSL